MYYHFTEKKNQYRKFTFILTEGDCFSSDQLHYMDLPLFYS